MKFTALIFMLALSFGADAQVNKCKMPDGRYTYSDKPCATAAQGGQIRLRGNTLGHEGQRAMIQREQIRQYNEVADAVLSGGGYDQGSAGQSQACRMALRNAELQSHHHVSGSRRERERNAARQACGTDPWAAEAGGPSTLPQDVRAREEAERQAARRARAERNTGPVHDQLINCDGSGCWGTSGKRYNPSGDGMSFHRSDGKFCTTINGMATCN